MVLNLGLMKKPGLTQQRKKSLTPRGMARMWRQTQLIGGATRNAWCRLMDQYSKWSWHCGGNIFQGSWGTHGVLHRSMCVFQPTVLLLVFVKELQFTLRRN